MRMLIKFMNSFNRKSKYGWTTYYSLVFGGLELDYPLYLGLFGLFSETNIVVIVYYLQVFLLWLFLLYLMFLEINWGFGITLQI